MNNHLATENSNFTFMAANSFTRYRSTKGMATLEHLDYLHLTQ